MLIRAFLSRGGLLLLAGLLLSGCGGSSNRAAIHGQITLDGEPLADGTILFSSLDETRGQPTGAAIHNGRYDLPAVRGPALGRNRVVITSMRSTGVTRRDPMLPEGQTVEVMAQVVAPQFSTNSTLEADVKPRDNEANFDVLSR